MNSLRRWAGRLILAALLWPAPHALAQQVLPTAVPASPWLNYAPGRPPFSADSQARWSEVPRVAGRLHARDIGLVINIADPYSVAVGAYYAQRRGLKPAQVLHVELPLKASLTELEFEALNQRIQSHFGADTQALALAWVQPYAVACNSITSALALGFDAALCKRSCNPTHRSPYANSASTRPFSDLGMRLSMLLAARDIDAARELIDRGVAADDTLGWHGAPPANAYFLSTGDAARNVRQALFPPSGWLSAPNVDVHVEPIAEFHGADRVLLVQTGLARLPPLHAVHWLAGGLGDHLTSYGGQLSGTTTQSTALDWIAAGATASYGTVSEPCNHLQKFPHPQWLLLHYLQGSTAIEAYWKSVAWPQQGLFVGEPLAAPFARD